MRNIIDFSSWQGALATLLGLALVSLIAVGIRLLVMQTVQQRRERANRQINERLKTLIAAYKTLGGSFTGNLTVDPSHLSERRSTEVGHGPAEPATIGSDRRRRLRDAVEAALSDVMLLGTPEQVRLAVQAANDMVAGQSVETAALVVSLRTFIREVLDLDAIPADVSIPKQGPLRPAAGGSRAVRGERTGGTDGGRKGDQSGDGAGASALGQSQGLEAGASGPDASDRP
jgi:type II secretory pathway pseudopilin PulG